MPQSPAGHIVKKFVRDLGALTHKVQEDDHGIKVKMGTVGMEV